MYALVTAAVVAVTPTPLDLLTASADLHAPADAPALTSPSPRARLAMLIVMVQRGALDADAGDMRWFHPDLTWPGELNCARGVVARVRDCPADDAPPRAWLAAQAADYSAAAAAYRARAAEYRSREEWEPDRAEGLSMWSVWFEGQAAEYDAAAYRYAGWSGQSWQRPRRVVAAEWRAAFPP